MSFYVCERVCVRDHTVSWSLSQTKRWQGSGSGLVSPWRGIFWDNDQLTALICLFHSYVPLSMKTVHCSVSVLPLLEALQTKTQCFSRENNLISYINYYWTCSMKSNLFETTFNSWFWHGSHKVWTSWLYITNKIIIYTVKNDHVDHAFKRVIGC